MEIFGDSTVGFLDYLQAYNGAITAIATIVLAIFTGVLSYFTIRLARATKVAADAAKASADALIDNERPWVGPLTVACEQVGSNLQIVARVVIQNTGKTPARNMRAVFVGSVEPRGVEPSPPDLKTAPSKALFPGIPDIYRPFTRQRHMTPQEFDGICKGTQTLWIVGRIEYLDNRGIERRTNVRARWDQSQGVPIPHEIGNDAT